jgi:hypothetical protein
MEYQLQDPMITSVVDGMVGTQHNVILAKMVSNEHLNHSAMDIRRSMGENKLHLNQREEVNSSGLTYQSVKQKTYQP